MKPTLEDKYKSYLKVAIFNFKFINNNIYVNDYLIRTCKFPLITQRDIDVVILKNVYKWSYRQIGNKYNITKQRAFSIYKTAINNIKLKYFIYLINY